MSRHKGKQAVTKFASFSKEQRKCEKERARQKKARKKEGKNPFFLTPGNVGIGTTIIGVDAQHHLPKRRPFGICSIFTDSAGNITGAEAFSKVKDKAAEYYAGNIVLSGSSVLETNTSSYFANQRRSTPDTNTIYAANNNLDISFLADFVLRRAFTLLFCKNITSGSLKAEFEAGNLEIRHGILLNTIFSNEVRTNNDDFIVLDVADAPIKQCSYVTDFLSQGDIDRISLIARNYSKYCLEKKLDINWPKAGTYPNWPKELLAFGEKPPEVILQAGGVTPCPSGE